MSGLRVFTVLDATLPAPIALSGQNRLWVVAGRRADALALVDERGITFREPTFAGPLRPGRFLERAARLGLLRRAAVYAYAVPHGPGSPVLLVESPSSVSQVATMADLLGVLAGGR